MSVPYVARWAESDDPEAIKTYANIVDKMARQIEEACDAAELGATPSRSPSSTLAATSRPRPASSSSSSDEPN